MPQLGIWHITDGRPRKLTSSVIELEEHLEEWIERDPAVLESGLTIVGRQVRLDPGPLDLLALDPQGQWVVIELKRSTLYRDTLAQALDYASCIAMMPFETLAAKVDGYLARRDDLPQRSLDKLLAGRFDGAAMRETPRDVRIVVAGAGRDRSLDRVVGYLAEVHSLPISVVSFQVFETPAGERVLVRELGDGEPPIPEPRLPTVEDLCARADSVGIGSEFRKILAAARQHGLGLRPNKISLTFTPPSKRNRCLFAILCDPAKTGDLWVWVTPEAFAQLCQVAEDDVVRELGPGGKYQKLPKGEVDGFVAGLHRLFEGASGSQGDGLMHGTISGTMLMTVGADESA